jgi:hypothetical protein
MTPFVARIQESRSKIVVETVTSPPDSPRALPSDVVWSEVAPAVSRKARPPVDQAVLNSPFVSGNSVTPNTSKTRSVRLGGVRRFRRPPSSRVPPSDVVQPEAAPSTAPLSQAKKIPTIKLCLEIVSRRLFLPRYLTKSTDPINGLVLKEDFN